MTKKKNLLEKKNESIITNDGYMVSEFFCNPMNVTSELNKVSQ